MAGGHYYSYIVEFVSKLYTFPYYVTFPFCWVP
jgi:hypothetical protein